MHLYKFYSACRYIALTAIVKLRIVSPKRLGTNKFVRTKSHTGSKFSQMSLKLLCTGGTVVVHLYYGFSLYHSKVPNSEPHVFVNFVAL